MSRLTAMLPVVAADVASNSSLSVASTQSLGDYIATWVQGQEGQYVASEAQPHSHECWDLAEAAIEHARHSGFNVPKQPSSYAWSLETVNFWDAQPGDVLQFANYREKVTHADGSWNTKSTGSRHTAVVIGAFDSDSCGLRVDGQNPHPVQATAYHPCDEYRLGGVLVVYRLGGSSVSPKPEGCITKGLQQRCQFPFTYESKTFSECTTYDNGKPWCATKLDHGAYMYGYYGECDDSCFQTSETVV